MKPSGDNIVLIGMPGAGKSTVGVLLAKELSRGFIDTDLVVQAAEGRRLQDIVDKDGSERFRAIEEHPKRPEPRRTTRRRCVPAVRPGTAFAIPGNL